MSALFATFKLLRTVVRVIKAVIVIAMISRGAARYLA